MVVIVNYIPTYNWGAPSCMGTQWYKMGYQKRITMLLQCNGYIMDNIGNGNEITLKWVYIGYLNMGISLGISLEISLGYIYIYVGKL